MATEEEIRARWLLIEAVLGERQRRLWAAAEAKAIGWGGVRRVSRATGVSQNTIRAGLLEIEAPGTGSDVVDTERHRRAGGGRKPVAVTQAGLEEALEKLVSPSTRGDPMSPLRWTLKSTSQLTEALLKRGFEVSVSTVGRMLKAQGYSLQSLRKTKEGTDHPDRDQQFRHIERRVVRHQRDGHPVISIDCKKKELIGDFKNGGREWQPAGEPEPVRVHDFVDKNLGKAIPYGVYDISRNEGWVSVGIDHETADFATNTIQQWWRNMGSKAYPHAKELLVVADGGGANGSRRRGWKLALQDLADRTGLKVHVSHLPPGTSKWNKIEHRMFCHITQNWRGRPLLSQQVVVNLIAATTTRTGLRIKAKLDTRSYPIGQKIDDAELAQVNIRPDNFHGDWNYTVGPAGMSLK